MAAHHFEERADVGRATRGGGQHVADLYEVVGPEDAGSGDGEELRVDRSGVGELMDVPATDADRVAGSDLAGEAVGLGGLGDEQRSNASRGAGRNARQR